VKKCPLRFLFFRTPTKRQQKGPIQRDLFVPHAYGYEFKVMVTNKTLSVKKAVAYHEGVPGRRGSSANSRRIARWATCRCGTGWAIGPISWPGCLPTICCELQMRTTEGRDTLCGVRAASHDACQAPSACGPTAPSPQQTHLNDERQLLD
jgi:hypothetical protein